MSDLDRLIHEPARLRLMALLFRNRSALFTWVRDTLGMTDGNLGAHAAKLIDAGYLEGRRVLTARGFQVQYRITSVGEEAFRRYLAQLRSLLEAGQPAQTGTAGPGTPQEPPPPVL